MNAPCYNPLGVVGGESPHIILLSLVILYTGNIREDSVFSLLFLGGGVAGRECPI